MSRGQREKGQVERPDHMPHAAEAEACVLSILAQWPSETRAILTEEQVSEEWFYRPGHAAIYRLIVGEMEASRRVDFITLATRARDLAIEHEMALQVTRADTENGAPALSSLFTLSPSMQILGTYLDELREKYLGRRLMKMAETTMALIKGNWQSAGMPLVKDTLSELQELASFGVRNDSVKQINPFVMEAVQKVHSAHQSRGGTAGLSTGIAALDRCLNGIKSTHSYYIAGRPAMGKSAMMGDLASFIALNPDPWQKAHVLVFSLEMTPLQLVQRELLKRSGVPLSKARTGMLSDKDMEALPKAARDLAESRIYVDDTSVLTMDDIAARTRRFVRQVRSKETAEQRAIREKSDRPDVVICIDYLQRVKGSSKRARENRYLELAEVCQGISVLLKDLKIAGIIPVQLGRDKNEGPEKFPILSDLRESGDIEAEAHVVIAMHRPYYYLKTQEKRKAWCEKHSGTIQGKADDDGAEFGVQTPDESGGGSWRVGTDSMEGLGERDLAHLAYACVLKQREGPVPQIMVHFEPSLAHFSNWNKDETTYSNNPAHRQGAHHTPPPNTNDDEQ